MKPTIDRRGLLAAGAALAATSALSMDAPAASAAPRGEPFRHCLNTSTIRRDGMGIVEKIDIAAKAGYQGVEPWLREIDEFQKNGGDLADLKKRIADAGLAVESAIGFSSWIVDDPQRRAQGLEQAKREMDVVRQIGGRRIAAPPAGATRGPALDLVEAGKRYRALLELGEEMDVTPQLEVWGFSQNLSRLSETTFVAIEAGHPKACILGDVFHLYKGGADFDSLKLLSGAAMHVFHVNDYPATPDRQSINDADRVFPGDGAAPLKDIFASLHQSGFRGALSLELFNPDYWKRDPLETAKVGLEKTRRVVSECFG